MFIYNNDWTNFTTNRYNENFLTFFSDGA